MSTDISTDLGTLGALALASILTGTRVTITHAAGWKRPVRWPAPSVRGLRIATESGQVTHEYNTLHLLQYIQRLRSTPTRGRTPVTAVAAAAGRTLF